MRPKSTGRITKAKISKNDTRHQKNHRWETFTTKIAKFNSLQPLRRVRRNDLETEDLSATTSYFQAGLQKWGELNIAKGFVGFKREVLPLSESLAQILHFENRIMGLLEKYISMQEKESLEPLLELLTAFAHDLGARFEKHYGTSLNLIVAIAGRPQDVEVIEWTFAALAFLFKYLAKLLVPDLRPTFDVVSPLMGKAKHPPHIARFAAEAMSFLVKKAGAPSHREGSLASLVQHVRKDCYSVAGDRQFTLYKDGIMTMFAEAIKGTDHMIHSTGPAILATLMDALPEGQDKMEDRALWTDVVCGVLTSSIHHATPETFTDYCESIFDKLESAAPEVLAWRGVSYIRILGTLAGVRRGGRITSWGRLVQLLGSILEQTTKASPELSQDEDEFVWKSIMINVAVVWYHAPIDALIPQLSRLMQSLTREPLMKWFIPFCSYTCELDSTRFGSLLRNELQKYVFPVRVWPCLDHMLIGTRFIASHWSQGQNEDLLCILLPRIIENSGFQPAGEKDNCRLPQGWQDQIVSRFETLEISPFPERGPYHKDPQVWRDRCLPKYSALLRLLELASVHPSTNARIAELLLKKLKLALRPSSTLASDEVAFIVGQGFHAYLRMSKAGGSVDGSLSTLLRAAVPRFAQSVGFLNAYLAYEELEDEKLANKIDVSSSDGSSTEEDPVTLALVENLSSPSHDIRLASLKLLRQMHPSQDAENPADIMVDIEQLPLDLAHTRTFSMHFRKLAQLYPSMDESSWLRLAVPSFIFGMLTVKLSPVWDDATETLKDLSRTKHGEENVSEIAFRWLKVPSPKWTPPSPDNSSASWVVTEFDCTALKGIERRAEDSHDVTLHSETLMRESFDESQTPADAFHPQARGRALKVLNAVPFIAERRSRQLVPHFLCWAAEDEEENSSDSGEEPESSTWSMADRKAMLGVFSQFINPKVLFQHEKVYVAILHQLENGDGEVQKFALKALLAWKQEGVKAYQENLEFLLDEARFKNELTVFLQGENIIKPEHRPELMPVLLRLLYGRTIAKKGAASGKHGLHATRLTVLRNLSIEDMGAFLQIALGKLKDVQVVGSRSQRDKLFKTALITPRKQVGLLNMASSLITELGTNVTPYMEVLLNAVLYCLIYASRQLQDTSAADKEDDAADKSEDTSVHSLLKVTRSTGLKCLIALFQNAQAYQWDAYHDIIVEEVVAPRLENLPSETMQGVSGVLQLLSTWAALPRAALFLAPHGESLPDGALPQVIACLGVEKAKEEVKLFILAMVRNLVRLALATAQESEFNELIKAELLDPNADVILSTITSILELSTTSTELLEACVETIVSMAPALKEIESVESVLRMSSFLLKQPPRRVNPKIKGRVLLIVQGFVQLVDPNKHAALCNEVYDTLASLFSYFKDRENRQSLAKALAAVSGGDSGKQAVSEICADLNSWKQGRVDEPDYDKRLAAYNRVSKERDSALTPQEWLPILHNCIFFIRMDEEFGVLSSNSADALRRFVQDTVDCEEKAIKSTLEGYLESIFMPALYAGAREPSEMVRREYLRVLGFMLSRMPEWPPIKDLKGLLDEVSEESAEPLFFFNLLSPATARQLEALRALEAAIASHEMASQNIAQFFIPLLEHFIYGREDGADDHGLSSQAGNTIGNLAQSLHWKHYRTTLHRYIGYVGSRSEQQKQTIRLLGKFTDALLTAAENRPSDGMEVDETEATSSIGRRLPLTMLKGDQLNTEVIDYFLPMLVKHLHEKDESEVSYRVPVGITIVKLLKLLPEEQMDAKLAGVLTDISHILRSKSLEARDMTRDTLVKIASILGPSYFGFLLRELRSALTRGYQLHVLSFTMHSILLQIIPTCEPGDLDYCLSSIVTVVMDDIFGVIGQEKDAEGYTTQMKEIKSSKSQDSMELIAKTASIGRLIELIKPVQALLMQKVDLKMVRKMDTLLTRVSTGLAQNPASESRDTLVLCYEIIQNVYNAKKPQAEPKLDPRVKKYLVQKGAKKSGERGQTSRNTYKLTRFAFDVMRSTFKKYDSLRTVENLAGFLPIIGDAILDGEDEVKMSAFRLLAVIVKVPFDDVNIFNVAVRDATKSISQSTSTTTDLAQAALKMLAVILRDRKDVVVKDHAVDMLLGKLKDDLTEPLYRHVTFNFLRAVLDRHVETAAVYDTMDYVGTVMITNDDKNTRDLARGAFFQFIREYPQKKARWAKQLNFIVANLKYEREGGRLSVMEALHLLLMKTGDDFVQEVASTCFLPLFFVLANDDSEKCRLSAGELIKKIFERADKERTQGFLTLLRSWLEKDDNVTVLRLALIVYTHYFESSEGAPRNKKDLNLALDKISGLLALEDLHDQDGELVEAALGLARGFVTAFPEKMLASSSEELWLNIGRCMGHPHPPVKLGAIRLISLYLADFAQHGGSAASGKSVKGSHGLELSAAKVQNLVRLALNILNGFQVDEDLAAEAGQILIFLAPRLPDPVAIEEAKDEADEDDGAAQDDDDEEEEEGDEEEVEQVKQKDLGYMFWRLSHILRKEIAPKAVAIGAKVVAMDVLETTCRRAPRERLEPCFKTILTPLHNLTDPTIPAPFSTDDAFKAKHEHVKTRAQIAMDALQKKLGTAAYTATLVAVRDEVRARRRQRSSKRKIEAIAAPEKHGRDKRKKFEKNRDRKKSRATEQKKMRQSFKGW